MLGFSAFSNILCITGCGSRSTSSPSKSRHQSERRTFVSEHSFQGLSTDVSSFGEGSTLNTAFLSWRSSKAFRTIRRRMERIAQLQLVSCLEEGTRPKMKSLQGERQWRNRRSLQPVTSARVTDRPPILLDMVLARARKDPGIWNELHKLGWVQVSYIEEQWRALEGWQTFYRNWFDIYQKLRRALHHTDTYKEFRTSILDRDGCCVKCEATSKL